MTDNEAERARLARVYSGLSDEGLAEFAAEANSLTDIARSVLIAELSSRGISLDQQPDPTLSDQSHTETTLPEQSAQQHSEPLVTVRRYRDLPEALIAKSILDSAQLDSFLADETMVRFSWFYSNLIGGTKLMVRPEDAAEADALLDESANSEIRGADGQGNSTNTIGDESE